LRDADRFGPWLLAIARNAARHARRAGRDARDKGRLEPLPEDVVAPRDDVASNGTEILAMIRGLPETYRETLALRLVEGLSGPEIAAATGLTHGSVRVNLHRGMQLLRERLRAEGYA
jgi:RNA polymerase sigma-70 factor (ECF subfamily)